VGSLSLTQAQTALEASLAKANELGSPSSVAVIDDGRELLAFARMDGDLLASAAISQAKAYTSRSLGCDTRDVEGLAQPGGALFGIHAAHLAMGKALITFGGGVLVTIDGQPAGVSGGTLAQDHEVAAADAAGLAG
jgi:uncharacterized protein GlcG (DUF336 family)